MAKTAKQPQHDVRSRTVGDMLRAVLAGVLLVGLLGGIPYGLIRYVGNPLPSRMPTMEMLQQSVGVSTFIDILAVVVWLAWLQFAVCIAVELKAAVSGVGLAVPVPAAGASQLLARKLVVTMLLVSAGALTVGQASASVASAAQDPARTVAAVAAAQPAAAVSNASPTAAALQASDTAQAPAGAKLYQVKPHTPHHTDTLWGIAETHLGDGTRWKEIVELNKDRVQQDGHRITNEGLVRPGWLLVMPADATGNDLITSGPPSTQSAAAAHTVVVHEGDTLSAIAQRELGNADDYPQLLEATQPLVQRDGSHITDTDEIFPGDLIVIPAVSPAATPPAARPTPEPPTAPTPTPAPPTTATPPAPASAPTPAPNAPTPAAQVPITQPPAASASGTPGQTAPPTPAPADPTPATAAPAPAGQSRSPVSAQTVAGIAALLAAGLLGVIAWRRREQQRSRKPGETIAMPDETSPAEQVLDRSSAPASVALLDVALRTLAHHHPDALPVIRGARVTSDRVEILVDDPDAEALSPFTDRPGGWWGVRADRASLLTPDQARDVPAPYPSLATIGADASGTHLLANLPFSGVLLLDGTEQQVREVARGIAMEAGTAAWADHIEVMTTGFGLELQQLLPQCRVMFSPGLSAANADLARVLVEAHQAEKEGGEPPLPWLLVCATTPSPEELYEFADLMGKARGLQLAAVLPAAGARDIFPNVEVLDAAVVAEPQRLEVLDTEVVLQRVTDEAYRQLTATMTTAVQPPVKAEGAWAHVPDPDRSRFGPAAVPSPSAATRGHLLLVSPPTTTATDADPEPEGPDSAAPASGTAAQNPEDPAASTVVDEAAETGEPDAAEPVPAASTDPVRTTALTVPPRTQQVSVVRDNQPQPAPGSAAPQVQVLGPLRITGIGDAPLAPNLANLAAMLIFKNERDYGSIANRMDSARPWSPQTMDQQMSRLRSRLGLDSTGQPYLRPKPRGVEQYTLSEEVTCDWSDFLHLSERGLPHGPMGILDLEAALALVRGRPFGGAGAHNWAAPLVQHMVSRITDIAHTIAVLRGGDDVLDVDAARHAVCVGLGVEPTAEILYRDWLRVEHCAGHLTGLHTVIDQARQMAQDWEITLQDETDALINKLTTGRGAIKGL